MTNPGKSNKNPQYLMLRAHRPLQGCIMTQRQAQEASKRWLKVKSEGQGRDAPSELKSLQVLRRSKCQTLVPAMLLMW